MPAAALVGSYRQYSEPLEERAVSPVVPSGDQNASSASSQHLSHAELSAYMRLEPAPIDTAAFGKRLAEIIAKATLGTPRRRKR